MNHPSLDLVIVSGAGRGIGRAAALALGASSIPVLCVSRTDNCVAVATEIKAAGGKADALPLDLADYAAVCEKAGTYLDKNAARRIGLVAAAGILGPRGPVWSSDLAGWDHAFRVNALGNIALLQAALPRMRETGFGRAVFFAGGGSAYAYPTFPSYAISKTGLVREVENLGEEMRDLQDFSAVILAPGAVDTDILADVRAAGAEVRTLTNISEPVGFVTSFLSSPEARRLSGRFVHVRDTWREVLAGQQTLDDKLLEIEAHGMIRIGFIGAGLIGKERVRATQILINEGHALQPTGLVDPHAPHAAESAASIGTTTCPDLDSLLATKPDWVVVATPHDTAVEMLPRLLASGVKILVEKPLGRSLKETEKLGSLAKKDQFWIGHNYRFYGGIAALLKDVKEERFGPLTSVSMLLGHGGGPKDKGTWKLDPVRAGGGVIIDPGIHLIDLINCIEGKVPRVVGGTSWSGFWKTGIEEDIHVLLQGEKVPAYDLNVSIVRWRSTCRIEVHGTEGYGIVEGRGRSYGPQRYVRGPRWGWQQHKSQAESEELVLETDGADVFADEMRALLFGKTSGSQPCSLTEALDNMRLLENIRSAISAASH